MVRAAIGSIAARVAAAISNLLLFAVAGHRLGAEGLGTMGLIALGITLAVLLGNVVCGGALTYLASRVPRRALLWRAYVWAVGSSLLAYGVIRALGIVPAPYVVHVAALSLITVLFTSHTGLLLGHQRIKAFSWTVILQSAVLLLVFIGITQDEAQRDPMAYVLAGYVASGITLLASVVLLLRVDEVATEGTGPPVWPQLLRFGGFTQLANALQLLTYRCSYWFIDRITGIGSLGVYTVGTQVAESAWLAPRGLATVLFGKLSNTKALDDQRKATLTVLKAAVAFALLSLLALLIMPEGVYRMVFGPQVTGIPMIILYMSPGIAAMAASQAFGMFFSGTGRNHHNAIGSGIALVITLVVGALLIPEKHLHGAAVTATLAYMANTLYQGTVFLGITGTRWRDLLPHAGDLRALRDLLKRK